MKVKHLPELIVIATWLTIVLSPLFYLAGESGPVASGEILQHQNPYSMSSTPQRHWEPWEASGVAPIPFVRSSYEHK